MGIKITKTDIYPVAENTTINAGDFVILSSNKASTTSSSFDSSIIGVAYNSVAQDALSDGNEQRYITVAEEGQYEFTGLVEANTSNYSSAISVGDYVAPYNLSSTWYVVKNDSNTVGRSLNSLSASVASDGTSGTIDVALDFSGLKQTMKASSIDAHEIDVSDAFTWSGAHIFGSTVAMSANTATLTHTGTTSLTIASTSGVIIVESVTFTGGAITACTSLTVDNLVINGNDISSSTGHITLSPVAGSAIQLDAHWQFDGVAMTALTDANTTMTAYAGKNITIESVTFDGGAVGGVSTLSMSGDLTMSGNTVNITHSGSTSLTITSTSGVVAVEGVTFTAAALSGVSTIGMSGDLTLSANSANITHSGSTSLTIASTSGTVIVESVTFTGGALSGVTGVAIAGTGAAASSKALSTAGYTLNNGNLTDGYGAVEVDLTVTGTAAGENSALSSWINFDAAFVSGGNRHCAITTGMYAPTGADLSSSHIVFGMRMDCLCQAATVTSTEFYPFSCVNNTNITTAIFQCNAASSDLGEVTNAGSDLGTLVPFFKDGAKVGYVKIYALV